MKRLVKPMVLLLALAVTCSVALAKFAKPEDAVKYRKAVMQVTKKHFGSMAGAVKGKLPYDKAAFSEDAKVVAMMSRLPWEASLVPGSFSGDTTLKEKALKDADGYRAAAKAFEDAGAQLLAAAESGDMGRIKPAFGATAKTCGGCHKPYRK